MINRRNSRKVMIGGTPIGGDAPIAIQSMTNTKTEDVEATVSQIIELEKAGCEIIRSTVPTMEAAEAFRVIRSRIHIPLVADIHFDYKLAIAAMENGADKIRINPGNIGGPEKVREVVACARERNIPIRVGVNSGSLEKRILEKNGGVTAAGLVESAMDKVRLIEDAGYDNLVISIKTSDVPMAIEAHELIAGITDLPLHVGITEAGTVRGGTVFSAVGELIVLWGVAIPLGYVAAFVLHLPAPMIFLFLSSESIVKAIVGAIGLGVKLLRMFSCLMRSSRSV